MKKKERLSSGRPGKHPVALYAGIVLVVVGVLAVVIFLMYFPYMNPYPSLDPQNRETIEMELSDAAGIISLNNEMNARYNSTIYPEGKARIDAELAKVRQISDPEARLDEIFTWEMKTWIRPDNNITAFPCLNDACTYQALYGDPNRVKASPHYDGILYPQKNPAGTYFADDPYWIAYNMVGECREFSALFSYMAEESGIPARLVRGPTHQWTEVDISGESYYYDPWCADQYGYYNAADGNMTFRDRWFNRIRSFQEYCHPPDPSFPITYKTFPYIWATPRYLTAFSENTLISGLNTTVSKK